MAQRRVALLLRANMEKLDWVTLLLGSHSALGKVPFLGAWVAWSVELLTFGISSRRDLRTLRSGS